MNEILTSENITFCPTFGFCKYTSSLNLVEADTTGTNQSVRTNESKELTTGIELEFCESPWHVEF